MKLKGLVLAAAIILVFCLTRFLNLLSFPMFLDEALYFRWVQAIQKTNQWLLPLKEFGWEPLSVWFSTLLNFLVNDALLSLRLTAVFFGALSLIILYFIFKHFFSRSLSSLAGLTYLLSPIILLHDRLGLRGDSLINFTFLLFLWAIIKKKTFFIGLAIALGLMTKSTAVILMIIAVATFNCLPLVAAVLPLIFFVATNTFSLVLAKSRVFVNHQAFFSQFWHNLIQAIPWLIQYLTWPVILLALIGIIFSWKQHRSFCRILIISFLASFLFMLFTAQIFFPRYLLISYQTMLIFAGLGLVKITRTLPDRLKFLGLFLLTPAIVFSCQIILEPKKAPWPPIERWQYISGWPSGYAVNSLIDYLKPNPPDILILEPNDLIFQSLNYYWPEHNLNLIQLTENNTLTNQIDPQKNAYLALNVLENPPDQFKTEFITSFKRPENQSSIKLYKVLID